MSDALIDGLGVQDFNDGTMRVYLRGLIDLAYADSDDAVKTAAFARADLYRALYAQNMYEAGLHDADCLSRGCPLR